MPPGNKPKLTTLMADQLRQMTPGTEEYYLLLKAYQKQKQLELQLRKEARKKREGKSRIDWASLPGFPKDAPVPIQEAWKKAELKARKEEH